MPNLDIGTGPEGYEGFNFPVIDLSQCSTTDKASQGYCTALQLMRSACLHHGFFLITGHGISTELQTRMFEMAEAFFSQTLEEKLVVDEKKAWGRSHRGYQVIGGEAYEAGTLPDLKEGFQYGNHKDLDHPDAVAKRVLCGPNQWPSGLPGFRETMEEYHVAIHALAIKIFKLLSESLGVDYEGVFKSFTHDAANAVRLLHYPPHAEDTDTNQLGTGAHRDFGGITLLLTNDIPGLQVYDDSVNEWVGITPRSDAYIVNLGDIFQRYTGGDYKSSLHRVINKSSKDRYSIPYFFDGNLDAVLNPVTGIQDGVEALTVEEHMLERMTTSRARGKKDIT
ncbi:hypothetical protein BP5796_12657 [Coleophoma crateriformis]|uniref:Fe2OG dioxygenase domain-containing protein n=1 Tax=Coleophoma crateriformis TaxID=565419 RepID=A0A3D8Q694_9HELO|nr:hypothetical protein BP5796_12657 [Coleophoma crateriformis]